VNGQDSYDAKVVAVGKLATTKYLKVPPGFAPFDTDAAKVGRADARAGFTNDLYAQIYVLNKDVFDGADQQVKGALLRAELVRAGWYTSNYEVVEVAPAGAWQDVMHADLGAIRANFDDARMLSILLPLAAEHTFRTLGHHFLTGMESEYVAKYTQFFSACVQPNLANYLPPAVLYHTAAHWVSLSKALEVVQNPAQVEHLPNAVLIRATAAPAGMALVTTSAAILEAIATTGLGDELAKVSGVDIERIIEVSTDVKKDPGKYHVIPAAYGEPPLSRTAAEEVAEAKAEARKLAPVLQGFLDSLPRNSALSSARALVKHADVNPLMRKRAKTFFAEVGKTKAASMAALFSMDKRSAEAVKEEEVDEEE
jgi:hypothetical protein